LGDGLLRKFDAPHATFRSRAAIKPPFRSIGCLHQRKRGKVLCGGFQTKNDN